MLLATPLEISPDKCLPHLSSHFYDLAVGERHVPTGQQCKMSASMFPVSVDRRTRCTYTRNTVQYVEGIFMGSLHVPFVEQKKGRHRANSYFWAL